MEEEELADLRKQQREYEELRNAEKVEQQRLEEQERRLREEKHRRMKQAADVLRLEKETAEKLAAKAFAKSYLADLVPSVFNNLRENGYFYDPVNRDLETGFMPWIMSETMNELDNLMVGRLLLDNLIRDVVSKRDVDYKNLEKILLEQIKQVTVQFYEPESEGQNKDSTNSNDNAQSNDAAQNEEQPETSNQPEDVRLI